MLLEDCQDAIVEHVVLVVAACHLVALGQTQQYTAKRGVRQGTAVCVALGCILWIVRTWLHCCELLRVLAGLEIAPN